MFIRQSYFGRKFLVLPHFVINLVANLFGMEAVMEYQVSQDSQPSEDGQLQP